MIGSVRTENSFAEQQQTYWIIIRRNSSEQWYNNNNIKPIHISKRKLAGNEHRQFQYYFLFKCTKKHNFCSVWFCFHFNCKSALLFSFFLSPFRCCSVFVFTPSSGSPSLNFFLSNMHSAHRQTHCMSSKRLEKLIIATNVCFTVKSSSYDGRNRMETRIILVSSTETIPVFRNCLSYPRRRVSSKYYSKQCVRVHLFWSLLNLHGNCVQKSNEDSRRCFRAV